MLRAVLLAVVVFWPAWAMGFPPCVDDTDSDGIVDCEDPAPADPCNPVACAPAPTPDPGGETPLAWHQRPDCLSAFFLALILGVNLYGVSHRWRK